MPPDSIDNFKFQIDQIKQNKDLAINLLLEGIQ
jgi:hypothetical protein